MKSKHTLFFFFFLEGVSAGLLPFATDTLLKKGQDLSYYHYSQLLIS